MLKLKLWYFGHLMRKTNSFEKTLMLGKTEGGRRRGCRGRDGWMASPTQRTWVWVDSGSWWWPGRPGVLQAMGSQSQTRLSDWTELMSDSLWPLLCKRYILFIIIIYYVLYSWSIIDKYLCYVTNIHDYVFTYFTLISFWLSLEDPGVWW